MAQTCDKFVENLGRAKLCYVLPKYVLRYAWERSGDMRAAMRLALASEVEKVDDAACHGDTCKKPLCLSLCCMLQDGQAVDGHRDFITGAGFTEHTVFISWLLDKNGLDGWLRFRKGQSIPSQERKDPKPRPSVLPGPKQCWHRRNLEKLLVARREARSFWYFHVMSCLAVPAMLMSRPFFIHFSGLKDQDGMCLAPATKGHRCRKKRVCGIFCRQHYLDWSNDNKKQKIWGSVEKTFAQASGIWPRWFKVIVRFCLANCVSPQHLAHWNP